MNTTKVTAAKVNESRLGVTATLLDEELQNFERLAGMLARLKFDSEKNLEKGANTVNEAGASEHRLQQLMQDLVAALADARTRNEAATSVVLDRRAQIEALAKEHAELWEQLRKLGESAREITVAVADLAQRRLRPAASGSGSNGNGNGHGEAQERPFDAAADAVAKLDLQEITQKMDQLIDFSKKLVEAANGKGADELARQSDALRQQLQAARNKVDLVGQRLKL